VVEIRVKDPKSAPFLVQQKVLEHVSPVFARMCSEDGFVEGATGRLIFMDDDENVWHVFLYWLMKHEIDFTTLFETSAADIAIKCACFADKYNINEFFDEAMSCLVNTHITITIETLKAAFGSTTTNCPLRELLVEKAYVAVQAKTIKLDNMLPLDGTGFWPLYLKFDHTMVPTKNIPPARYTEQRAKFMKRSFRGSRKALAKLVQQ
jgi:hypothetical protein